MHALFDEIHEVVGALRAELHASDFEVKDGSWKETAALPLLLSSVELVSAMVALVKVDPHCGWIAAHTLHRPQFEHFVRGLYFLRPATEDEARKFVQTGKLPQRKRLQGKRYKKGDISRKEMTEAVEQAFEFGGKLASTYDSIYGPNSSLIHGGFEIVNIYWAEDELGPAKFTSEEIVGTFCNPLALACEVYVRLETLGFKSMGSPAVMRLLGRARGLLLQAIEYLPKYEAKAETPVRVPDAGEGSGPRH